MKYDCLIVDDEELLSESTMEYFNTFGVKTAWVSNAKACEDFFLDNTADIILLDINLEHSSGFDLCKKLREKSDIPILFISARTSDDDMLLALNIGGDDYIKKPYSLSILLAKVKAVLRRYKDDSIAPYENKNLKIDFNSSTVYVKDKRVPLKAMEYKLLTYLVKNKNRTITKDEIFRNVWEEIITTDNTLNVHIRYLREKIEEDANNPVYIKTIWGTGYIFESD